MQSQPSNRDYFSDNGCPVCYFMGFSIFLYEFFMNFIFKFEWIVFEWIEFEKNLYE